MAFTLQGKLIAANAFIANTKYVALLIGTTELTGHGYQRGTWATSAMVVADATAIISNNANISIYTPNDDSAQDATHVAFYDALSGGNKLTEEVAFADIPAPVSGQEVRILANVIEITI